jgi:antitoxin component of MazEF toxin-antitoxin module
MIIKRLHKIGSSKGIILDKALLKLMDATEKDLFKIVVEGESIKIERYTEDTNKKVV